MDIMDKFGSKTKDVLYVIFRVLVGILFFMHGYVKFGPTYNFGSLMGIAAIIEVIAGVLLVLGLFVRWTSFIAAIEMLVAYFVMHAPKGFSPLANGGELAILYFVMFCVALAIGNGRWSLQSVFK